MSVQFFTALFFLAWVVGVFVLDAHCLVTRDVQIGQLNSFPLYFLDIFFWYSFRVILLLAEISLTEKKLLLVTAYGISFNFLNLKWCWENYKNGNFSKHPPDSWESLSSLTLYWLDFFYVQNSVGLAACFFVLQLFFYFNLNFFMNNSVKCIQVD